MKSDTLQKEHTEQKKQDTELKQVLIEKCGQVLSKFEKYLEL